MAYVWGVALGWWRRVEIVAFMVEMKIGGIEQGGLLEPIQVGNCKFAAIELDQPVAPEVEHHSIDMHAR